MIKLTALYGHTPDPSAFEAYYTNTHMPIASSIQGVEKLETTKFMPGPDGTQPAYYRMVEFWFASPEAMGAAMGSPEGQAAAADIANFATGGVTLLVGAVDS
jgi:uncharacterized protein (TIGR02118 family)